MVHLLITFAYLIMLRTWGNVIYKSLNDIVALKNDQSILNRLFLTLFDDKIIYSSFYIFYFELYWFWMLGNVRKTLQLVHWFLYDIISVIWVLIWYIGKLILLNLQFNIFMNYFCFQVNVRYLCIHRCVNGFIRGD